MQSRSVFNYHSRDFFKTSGDGNSLQFLSLGQCPTFAIVDFTIHDFFKTCGDGNSFSGLTSLKCLTGKVKKNQHFP